MPVVVGAGRGDVEELGCAVAVLAADGGRIHLYRPPGVPWPLRRHETGVWAGYRPERTVRRAADRALTVTSQFGTTAAAARPGAYGRAGPWADAVDRLEATYGAGQVVHVSLEEFCRNLPSDAQEAERWREGGRSADWIHRRRTTATWARDVAHFSALVRRYRAFDRPNLLVLFPTWRPSRSFLREFGEAVECGPVWPMGRPRGSAPRSRRSSHRTVRWIWYASPASSGTLLRGLAEGARRAGRAVRLEVRSDRPLPRTERSDRIRIVPLPSASRPQWERRFAGADLRIVTGSRSLLEALVVGGPFLYFNGVTGTGARRRRHRPEKLDALLSRWRRMGVPAFLRRDLADFARARRVDRIVARALTDPVWRRAFPVGGAAALRDPHLPEGTAVVRGIARAWASSDLPAATFVRRTRAALRGSGPRRTLMERGRIRHVDAG